MTLRRSRRGRVDPGTTSADGPLTAAAVSCSGARELAVWGAPPMANMRRTVWPDRTSRGLPLMGRSVPMGWRGQRRRSTRSAPGAKLLDHPSVTFPRLLLGRVAQTGRVVSATDDQGLVDQWLIV